MHNRVSWADLELREGNVEEARELLREGLDAHPDFAGALLLLAKLERQAGQLDLAEAYARRAQKVGATAFCFLCCVVTGVLLSVLCCVMGVVVGGLGTVAGGSWTWLRCTDDEHKRLVVR